MKETNCSTSLSDETQRMPLITQLRRNHLLRYINLSGKGLEIGPYEHPTVFKSEADISYLDWKTREQLIEEKFSQDEVDSIPETDYLVKSNDYRKYIPYTFDYIIANHVLEHVPNFIQWFLEVTALLNSNGTLFLALPDKKFTFDKFRSETKLSHILSDFYEGVETTSTEHLLENEIYYDLAFIGKPMVVSERLDRSRLEAALSRGVHIGYHSHVFQSETVLDMIIKPLFLMGYVDLELLEFVPAKAEYGGEMIIICKKTWPRLPSNFIDSLSFYKSDSSTENEILKEKIERLENEKLAFLESVSWRITRPFRRIKHLFN